MLMSCQVLLFRDVASSWGSKSAPFEGVGDVQRCGCRVLWNKSFPTKFNQSKVIPGNRAAEFAGIETMV